MQKYWEEIRDKLKGWRFKLNMKGRNPQLEMWIFREYPNRIEVIPRPKIFFELLVTLHLAESKSEAARLVKSRGIQQREWYGDGWWNPVSDWVEGYPQWIRRGKMMYGLVTYMLPNANQTEGTWSELVFSDDN